MWLLYFGFGLTTAAMAPLVRPITRELGLSHAAMGSVFGAWPLVYIAAAIPCGVVLDRFGLRAALFAGGLAIGLSGVLRALAVDHVTLYLAVAVFGIGGPLVSVGAPKVISRWFEGSERGLAMGVYLTGPALGNITALALTNSVMMPLFDGRWRAVLLAYATFVLLVSVTWLALASHPASRASDHRATAERHGSGLRVFATLVRARSVRMLLVMGVGIFFVNHGLNSWLPEILRSLGMGPRAADAWAAFPTLVGIAGALVVPRLAVAPRQLPMLFALFLCAGVATLLLLRPPDPLLALGLTLLGIARSSMTAVAVLVLIESREVGARHVGAAGGLFFSAAEIGGMLGPLTIGVLYDLTGRFGLALGVLAAVCAGLMILVWRLERRPLAA